MGKSMAEKIVGEKDKNDALTISYFLGAESAKETIRALKKRIAELEDELVRVCDVLGDEDVALVHKLLGIKNVEDE